jgi:hypothetical protein
VTRTTPTALKNAARKEFENRVRGRFLEAFAETPEARAFFSETELANFSEGLTGPVFVVHHKQPLFRGGDNSFENLIVVPKDWHQDHFFELHFYSEGRNPFGLN